MRIQGQPAPALAIPGVSPQIQGAAPITRPDPYQDSARTQSGGGRLPQAPAAVPVPQAPVQTSSSGSAIRQVREDALELLREYDTIFIIDDSGSMEVNEMPDGSIGPSRWEEARNALCGVVETAAKYDDDGIDVHFINDTRSLESCRDPRQVLKLFADVKPNGATPTGNRLELLLLDYLDRIEAAAAQNKRAPGSIKGPKRRNVRCC